MGFYCFVDTAVGKPGGHVARDRSFGVHGGRPLNFFLNFKMLVLMIDELMMSCVDPDWLKLWLMFEMRLQVI